MEANRHFFAGNSKSDAKLQTHMSFFEKTSVGPRHGGVNLGYRRNASRKLGDGVVKKGAKICPPKNLKPFSDSKFNVDHDFAIKRDLTQSFDLVMGVRR